MLNCVNEARADKKKKKNTHASANDSVKFHHVKAFGSLQLEAHNKALSWGLIGVLPISIMTQHNTAVHTCLLTHSSLHLPTLSPQQTWEERQQFTTCDCKTMLHMIHHSVF